MTLVVVFRRPQHDEYLAFSDSRVSSSSKSISDNVSKILPLPVTVFGANHSKILSSSFGFAFSGSTLMSYSIFAFASAALQGLRNEKNRDLPSVSDIAEFVGRVGRQMLRDFGITNDPVAGKFEILIFGYCQQERKLRTFRIEAQIQDGIADVGLGEVEMLPSSACFIGDRAAIDEYVRQSATLDNLGPAERLQQLIQSGKYPGVGGSVQILRADRFGARAVPTLWRLPDKKGARLRLLTIPLEEFDPVGPCTLRNEAWGPFDFTV